MSTKSKRARTPHQPVGCWCRPLKRLSIYLRDGMACAWCCSSVEDGIILSLDHLRPKSRRGTNDCRNLVTSCKRCNDSRGNRTPKTFAEDVARYLDNGREPADILAHIRACTRRVLPVEEARELLARRGSVLVAVAGKAEDKDV